MERGFRLGKLRDCLFPCKCSLYVADAGPIFPPLNLFVLFPSIFCFSSSPSMISPSGPESPQYWTLPCTAFAVKKALKSFMPRSLPQTPLNRRLGSSFRTLTSSFRSPQPPSTANIPQNANGGGVVNGGSPAAAVAASLPAAAPPSSTTTSLPASPAIAKTAKLPASATFEVKRKVVDVDKVAKVSRRSGSWFSNLPHDVHCSLFFSLYFFLVSH